MMLLVFVLIVLLILLNLKKRKESNMSTLMRIMTNYLHMLTATASFNIGYPTYLVSFYEPGLYFGDTDALVSIDCFIEDEQLNLFGSSHSYLKAAIAMITPLVLITILAAYWTIAAVLGKTDRGRNNFILSSVVVLYLLHPSLTASCLGLFNCMELDNGQMWLLKDLQVRCWTRSHLSYALVIGTPMLIFWVIGLPVVGFVLIYRHKNHLQNDEVLAKYRMLYQGLRP